MIIKVFTSRNCRSCHPFLETVRKVVRKKFPGIKVVEVPVEKHPQEAARFWIRSTPTAILFQGDRPLDTLIGAYPPSAVEKWIKEWIN